MSRSNATVRQLARAFICRHPLREAFLDWVDEHEDCVDDLRSVVVDMAAGGAAPVADATLVERLSADVDGIREEWAPLLAHLIVWEFPELRHHLRLDLHRFAWLRSPRSERDDSHDVGPRDRDGEGGERA